MAGLANGPDGAHNRCCADTVKWAVGNLQRGYAMAIFLVLLGCSLSSMGLGSRLVTRGATPPASADSGHG
jgi:hypothetical protein